MALSGFGFVKEVLSGDTLVIIGQPRNGPPPELKLTLSSLQAPRLALKPTTMSATNLTTKDQEPFAWESRQFLRELCIGKRIFFKVEYTVQAIGRQFGAVYLLGDNSEGNLFGGNSEAKLGENVCLTVAREGWCTVRVREKGAEEEKSVDFDQLLTLSREAEAAKRGIFNTAEAQKSIRTVKWDFLQEKENNNTQSEVIKLYNQVKEKPVNAIIEYIRDGASVKALLLDSMTLITFNLAGVQCPRMNLSARATDEKATDPQEYAQEAKFFTEVRLLNREVKLRIGGVSEKFATFFGSIIHEVEEPGRSAVVDGIKYNGSIDFGSANGKKKKTYDIAVELIRNGLAMPTDWSMSYTTASNAAAIHAAVHVAKAAKLRLWKTYVAPVIPGDKEYTGVVTEVLSGDSFVVLVGSTQDLALQPWACEERKINLSSIRAPRLNRSGVDEPFARESKEFVRKKLIGKVVKVEVEYVIQGESGAGRKYGTVKANSNKVESNIACLLLEEGLASVIGHKQGAERSNYYHDLLEAEKVAKDQKKNIWDQEIKAKSDDEKQRKPIEVTTAQLAKTHLSSLKSDNFEKRVRGIVDYVFNGARMKIYVPSTNIYIVYNLSGVQCGRTADGKGKAPQKSDPFSEEATAYTKSLCLQRDVELLVEAVDKGGNFIGSLFFKPPAYSLKPPANSGAVSAPASSSYASKFSGQTSKRNPKAAGDMFTENLAIVLLQNGLAKVNKFGVKMARFGEEYLKEERNAKDSGIRLWENYVEVPEEEVDEEEAAELKKKETRNAKSKQMETIQVTVCHIDDGNNFHVHVKSEESKLKAVNERMEKLAAEYGLVPKIENPELMSTIQKNADVVALFDDGSKPKWYRAKVLRIIKNENGTRSANIQYCDFGNVEDVGADRLRVPNDATIFKTESLAHPCCLAFVTAPDLSNEYGQDAAMYLSQLTAPPRCLEAKVHGKDPKTNKLVLTLIPAGQTVKSKIANSAEETIATSSANDVSDVVAQGEVNAPKPTESASFKSGITVNGLLLKEGFVTMSRKARVYLWGNDEEQEIFEQMKKDQEYAHVNHMHLWEFGDPRPDEDDQRF